MTLGHAIGVIETLNAPLIARGFEGVPDMVKWVHAISNMEELDRYIREHASLEWWHSSVTDKPALISEAPTRRLVKVA